MKCHICDDWYLKSDQASKWDIWSCAEVQRVSVLILKCSWGNFAQNFAGIVKKVIIIIFFKSHFYKEFNPTETSEISEFRWLYSTSHKKNSPKYLLVGFSHDILHRFRLPTTLNLALYQLVSGFAKFWL